MALDFTQIGTLTGVTGVPIDSPTSIQFGPDGRLYVASVSGEIAAYEVAIDPDTGEFSLTSGEFLDFGGTGVITGILNHNDDGAVNAGLSARQVTGLVVSDADADGNFSVYVTSSDPRIGNAGTGDQNLDTNSSTITRVDLNADSTITNVVDIVRGLPRSEENHAANGLQISPDGNSLFVALGGNTNDGGLSNFFNFLAESSLSGSIIEIDLNQIAELEANASFTDAGQDGSTRTVVYDLPTLDDVLTPNAPAGLSDAEALAAGFRENSDGLDLAGPFGGNDGLNQAILPADAPISIFADGFRNLFDIAFNENGQLISSDNVADSNFGGRPVLDGNGDPINGINENGISGQEGPIFLVEEGGSFGHPAPQRANPDAPITSFDSDGNPLITINPLDQIPDGIDIADGFLIDPSRFATGDGETLQDLIDAGDFEAVEVRLALSGSAEERGTSDSLEIGSFGPGLSSQGIDIIEEGILEGFIVATQFGGGDSVLEFANLSDDGTSIVAFVNPFTGAVEADGIFAINVNDDVGLPNGINANLALDVTVGPNGTILIANFGSDNITVIRPDAPVELPVPDGDFEAGDVLIAVNANGGALQTVVNGEVVDFAANTGTGNGSAATANGLTAVFTGANGFADGTGNSSGGANGQQAGFDGTVFDSERFGQDLGFNVSGLEPGQVVFVDLLFAELFQTGTGDRVFDVEIEGADVLNNFDILGTTGDINTASIQSFGPLTVSADGVLNVDFGTDVDNAQITGVVVRGGVETGTGTPTPEPTPATGATDGNDALEGTTGNDIIDGGNGDDQIFAAAGDDTLFGSAGNDVLFGNAGEDVLDGGAGADTLNGNLDDDILIGGTGADILNGGSGNDDLAGDSGADVLFGGSGNDFLTGGDGADTFVFSAPTDGTSFDTVSDFEVGTDRLDVSGLADSFDDLNIVVNNGNVAIFFSEGQSVTFTNLTNVNDLSADDFIFGNAPVDEPVPTPTPTPEPNPEPTPTPDGDVLIAVNANGSAVQSVVNGELINFAANTGGGNGTAATANGLTAVFTGASGFSDGTGSNGGGANGPQAGFDGTVFDSERFGQDLGFDVSGLEPGQVVFVDLLFAELFQTSVGDRVFSAEIEGQEVLSDFDILEATGDINSASIQSFGPITVSADGTLNIDFNTAVNNAQITGVIVRDGGTPNAGTPTPTPTPTPVDDDGVTIEGTDGVDFLVGTEGADTIIGFNGPDNLAGDGGADVLIGGSGNDFLTGGSGADIFVFTTPTDGTSFDTVADFQVGIDRLDVSDLADSFDDLNIVNNNGNVAIFFSEGQSVTFTNLTDVNALSAEDFIFDGSSVDTPMSTPPPTPGIGGELLEGGSGDDFLSAGDGDDVLIGGSGNDFLVGGGGEDVFVLTATTDGASFDTIADFEIGVDRIDVSDFADNFDDLNIVSNNGTVAIFFSEDQSVTLNGITDVDELSADAFIF